MQMISNLVFRIFIISYTCALNLFQNFSISPGGYFNSNFW